MNQSKHIAAFPVATTYAPAPGNLPVRSVMGDKSDASHRLLRLSQSLAGAKQFLPAALALQAAAVSSSSSFTPAQKAASLTSAARFLLRAGGAAHAARARAVLHKAIFILDACPGCEALRLQAGSLLESASEGAAALHAVRACLDVVERRRAALQMPWNWWMYFKGREIALCEPKQAVAVAADAVLEAERKGDFGGAAALQLVIAQVDLGAVGPASEENCHSAFAAVREAAKYIDRAVGITGEADVATLRVCCTALSSMCLLRAGRVGEAFGQAHALGAAYEAARAAAKKGNDGSQWKWQNGRVLRSLVQHVLAAGRRSTGGSAAGLELANRALAWANLDGAREMNGELPAFGGRLGGHAEMAFVIVLLDSAARMRMSVVDLEGAAPLVRAALFRVQKPQSGVSLATQASAYLLAAEYFMLQGTHASAQRATLYLSRVLDTANGSIDGATELGDIAHMCRTYISLLTGDKRQQPGAVPPRDGGGDNNNKADNMTDAIDDPALDGTFTSAHVRSAALFADGVQEMRQANVLDAKRVLERAFELAGGGTRRENDQLVANIGTTLTSLYVSHPTVSKNTEDIVVSVFRVADASGDLITRARALRMKRKLISRAAVVKPEEVALVEKEQAANEEGLRERQQAAVHL